MVTDSRPWWNKTRQSLGCLLGCTDGSKCQSTDIALRWKMRNRQSPLSSRKLKIHCFSIQEMLRKVRRAKKTPTVFYRDIQVNRQTNIDTVDAMHSSLYSFAFSYSCSFENVILNVSRYEKEPQKDHFNLRPYVTITEEFT